MSTKLFNDLNCYEAILKNSNITEGTLRIIPQVLSNSKKRIKNISYIIDLIINHSKTKLIGLDYVLSVIEVYSKEINNLPEVIEKVLAYANKKKPIYTTMDFFRFSVAELLGGMKILLPDEKILFFASYLLNNSKNHNINYKLTKSLVKTKYSLKIKKKIFERVLKNKNILSITKSMINMDIILSSGKPEKQKKLAIVEAITKQKGITSEMLAGQALALILSPTKLKERVTYIKLISDHNEADELTWYKIAYYMKNLETPIANSILILDDLFNKRIDHKKILSLLIVAMAKLPHKINNFSNKIKRVLYAKDKFFSFNLSAIAYAIEISKFPISDVSQILMEVLSHKYTSTYALYATAETIEKSNFPISNADNILSTIIYHQDVDINILFKVSDAIDNYKFIFNNKFKIISILEIRMKKFGYTRKDIVGTNFTYDTDAREKK